MRSLKLALVLGLAVVAATPLFAQQQRRPAQGGAQGQPGRGQFGQGGGFGGTSPLQLVRNKSVQDELKIDEATKKKLDDYATEFTKKTGEALQKAGITGGGFNPNATAEERAKQREKMTEALKPLNEESAKFIKSTLSADQNKRLDQIVLQREGTRAYAKEEVKKALALTDEQSAKIKTITDDTEKDAREVMQGINFTDREKFQEAQKKAEAVRKEGAEKIQSVLTATQKTKWKEMVGAAFEYKPDAPRRPGTNN